jgi:integrase
MRGSIKERGHSYRLKVSLGKNLITGKYDAYYETVPHDKKNAEKRLRELLTELDKGTFIKPGKATLSEYLKTWLADYCAPNLSENTTALYTIICNKHINPTLGNVPLVELKPQHLQHLYADKMSGGLSNRSVQLIHVVLHKALKNALKIGLISRNVTELVDMPKIQHYEMHVMSETDVHLFLEMARNTEYYALFYTLLFTGMRRGEALALRWQDVDLILHELSVTRSVQYLDGVEPDKRISFKETKTQKSRRQISLSPSLVDVLKDHRDVQIKIRDAMNKENEENKENKEKNELLDSDLIFSHPDGSPLLPNSVTHAWIKVARRCGLKGIRLHDARHTHASIMLKHGIHPKIVQERLGHAGIAITLDLYSHVTPGLQQAAADKFDAILLSNHAPAMN